MNKLIPVLIPVFIVEIIANSAWIMVSYEPKIRTNTWLSYTIASLAGTLSGLAWCWMARSVSQNNMYLANLAWDWVVGIIFISLPIFYYGVKLDHQSLIGAIVAFAGLMIMSHE